MLAAQAAVALDNVRFAAKLEQKVAKRTAQLEQRANELTLINSIQQGVAAELNFQTIIDLVGDKLREIYGQKDLGIRIYDPESNVVHFPYTYENGSGSTSSPSRFRKTDSALTSCAPARRSSSTRT
jgi:nitrate/nitrite-specific signal transduction histidine kinase